MVRVGVIVSDRFHFQAGAKSQSALVKIGGSGTTEFIGLCYNVGPDVINYLDGSRGRIFHWRHASDLTKLIRSENIDVLYCDDYLPRMLISRDVAAAVHIPFVPYISIFHGLRALNPMLNTAPNLLGGLATKMGHYVPFSWVTRNYRAAIRDASCVVGNSMCTRFTLYTVYGLRSDMVAYPPTSEAFLEAKPASMHLRDPERFVLYAGNPGEHSSDQLNMILRKCASLGLSRCDIYGNAETSERFGHSFKGEWTFHPNLTDSAIAKLYAQAAVTIAPQLWEGFGYVGPESILCGTPVLLDMYQPWLEVTGPGNFARFLDEDAMLNERSSAYNQGVDGEMRYAQKRLKAALSPEAFAQTIAKATSLAQKRFGTRCRSIP